GSRRCGAGGDRGARTLRPRAPCRRPPAHPCGGGAVRPAGHPRRGPRHRRAVPVRRTVRGGLMAGDHRFRITRAGVLNVWQYDEQVFDFADGRLLLRGTNGAGKSKTMEMLLPFVIDGDTRRITASGRHQTSLLWLLMDGYDGQSRTGYVWVEFSRTAVDGRPETLTCGVGMRATAAARNATSW